MSESMVCCPLSSDADSAASCSTTVVRTARKSHMCYECRETIARGSSYEHCSGIWDGEPCAYKTCLSCVEIRDHFACKDGWLFGQLWEDLEQNFFPDMKAGGPCMAGLSPAAKTRLFERKLKYDEEQR